MMCISVFSIMFMGAAIGVRCAQHPKMAKSRQKRTRREALTYFHALGRG